MTTQHRPISERPVTAMVLAAGLGSRMRPLTDTTPKPLVPLAGRPLLDHVLDRLSAAGISKVIVNVHYLADQIEQHVRGRSQPEIIVSDERDALLETGGGVVRARSLLGSAPFIIHNSDSVWIERGSQNLTRLFDAWDATVMDAVMLLAPTADCLGYDGRGDFHLDADKRIRRRAPGETAPYVFAGVSIIKPELFDGEIERPFSLNVIWDRILASGRLSAIVLDGLWMHVGTPQALGEANAAIAAEKARQA